MALAQEINDEFTSVVNEESEQLKVDVLVDVQAKIENMLSELKSIDEHVYEEIQWGPSKPEFSLESLVTAGKIVQIALAQNKAQTTDDTIKSIYIVMLIASMPLTFKNFARLYRKYFKVSPNQSERYHILKVLDSITILNDAPGQIEYPLNNPRSEFSALEAEIHKTVNSRVQSILAPVNMLTNLLLNDHHFLSTLSPDVAKANARHRQSNFKVSTRSRIYYVNLFKDSIKDALLRIDALTEELNDVRKEKQSRVRELNKELKKAHDMVRGLQESDPLSDLFGLDINNSKDEEIATLTLRLEQLETRNIELQRENNRLHKKVTSLEFSDK